MMRAGTGVYNSGTPNTHTPGPSTSSVQPSPSPQPSSAPSIQQPSSSTTYLNTARPAVETTIISGPRDTLRTQFITREGLYQQMAVSDQLAKCRMPLAHAVPGATTTPVRVSFVRVPHAAQDETSHRQEVVGGTLPSEEACVEERICFNIGRDLYVYNHDTVKGGFDWTKTLDKRVYKGTLPSCHDFNKTTVTLNSCPLIIGFSAGQAQLIDPFRNEYGAARLFNEERLIERTPVTCIKWIPGSPNQFVCSHSTGNMFVYHIDYPCIPTAPVYQVTKQTEAVTVSTLKSRPNKNPLRRIKVGKGAIHQFEFAPESADLIAVVNQDGFMRVFRFPQMDLVCLMRSYFGGLLSVAWSPDSRFIATGGEDDLLTVFSVAENRVICRGQGHRSWISRVTFDPYVDSNPDRTPTSDEVAPILEETVVPPGSSPDDVSSQLVTLELKCNIAFLLPILSFTAKCLPCQDAQFIDDRHKGRLGMKPKRISPSTANGVDKSNTLGGEGLLRKGDDEATSSTHPTEAPFYRIGTISHDTHMCLWDVGAEVFQQLSQHQQQPCASTSNGNCGAAPTVVGNNLTGNDVGTGLRDGPSDSPIGADVHDEPKSRTKKPLHKRVLSFGARRGAESSRVSRNASTSSSATLPNNLNSPASLQTDQHRSADLTSRLFGTPQCPRMNAVPIIEPLIHKKISQERLTDLAFRQDTLITACQEGFIATWSRPGRVIAQV